MRRKYLALSVLWAVTVSLSVAGTEIVRGPVSGVWPSGMVYIVDDQAYVPAGKSLTIQDGVTINFLTTDAFEVVGSLTAYGTQASPITVTAPDDWGGFLFVPGQRGTDTLRCVHVGRTGGVPRHVVRAVERSLLIGACQFTGRLSCLEVSRGHLWADNNHFLTVGLFSKVVVLDSLIPVLDFPPGTARLNALENSVVMAEVPNQPVSPFDWQYTAALKMERSNQTRILGNTFSVRAPGYAFATYFGRSDAGSPVGASINFCVITAFSYNVQARGVVNAHEGVLDVRRCTIDAISNYYYPVGVIASNRAQSYVNSCIVQVNIGNRLCIAESGAQVAVMHTDLWRSSSSLAAPDGPGDRLIREVKDGTPLTVEFGEGVFSEDPQFLLTGEWGNWESPDHVRDYYSLLPTSPCINRGDPSLGADPDGTLPDVGRYYYTQTSFTPPRPADWAARDVMLPPYPNPFNATAMIRFDLAGASNARVAVLDVLGREVAVLASGRLAAGSHDLVFDGRGLTSGLYFAVLEVGGRPVSGQRLLLIK